MAWRGSVFKAKWLSIHPFPDKTPRTFSLTQYMNMDWMNEMNAEICNFFEAQDSLEYSTYSKGTINWVSVKDILNSNCVNWKFYALH